MGAGEMQVRQSLLSRKVQIFKLSHRLRCAVSAPSQSSSGVRWVHAGRCHEMFLRKIGTQTFRGSAKQCCHGAYVALRNTLPLADCLRSDTTNPSDAGAISPVRDKALPEGTPPDSKGTTFMAGIGKTGHQ
jgi:hypothetical protein